MDSDRGAHPHLPTNTKLTSGICYLQLSLSQIWTMRIMHKIGQITAQFNNGVSWLCFLKVLTAYLEG